MSNANKPEWMKDPLLQHIDPRKLEFLQSLVFESSGLNREQMMPFLLALARRGKDKNMTFSDEEMTAIISVLKKHSGPAELEKINKVMAMRSNKMNKK